MKLKLDAHGIKGTTRYKGGRIRREEVAICRAFFEQCEPTKTGRLSSYWLKHVIERAAGWPAAYVSNGACLKAALDLGLVVTPYGPRNPNAAIGVSRRSVRRAVAVIEAEATAAQAERG